MGHSKDMADSIKRGWEVTGDTDVWELLCKAVNHDTGEYHSTKVLRLKDGGCVLQCDSMFNGAKKGAPVRLTPRRSMLVLPSLPLDLDYRSPPGL